MAFIGMIVTISGIIAFYTKYGEQYSLKKGGLYNRIQSKRRMIEGCSQCHESSYEPPEEDFVFKEA
jgi:hypothetical protein